MSKASIASVNIVRYENDTKQHTVDLLAVEEPLEIRLGYGPINDRLQKSISVTLRTPGHDFELATGFLFTEGVLQSIGDIYKIAYCTEANSIENKENIVRVELQPDVQIDITKLQRNFYTTSSCGVCGKESIEAIKVNCKLPIVNNELIVDKRIIISLPEKLRAKQNVFEHTGGLHACALFDETGNLVLLREDVGRHNAMDKLVGAGLAKSGISFFADEILLLSGRASFELLQKAIMANIKIVCSVGAPSSLAVSLANEFDITLIGFLRGNKFNIYTNPQRVKI
jgi:FdhD protein